jgi:hypothetical protein
MSVNITTAFVQEYKQVLEQLVQQKGSRLRNTVRVERFYGKGAKAIEQVGKVTATKLTTRHGDTPQTDTPHEARWVFPSDFVVNDYIDDQDKLRMLVDPQSIYSKNNQDALGRAIDDEIIAAATGTAYVGENGTTSEFFDTTNWSIASGSVGLTIAKLRQARRMLSAAENDENEDYFCVLSADQIEDLLGETLAVSIDYNAVKPLVSGEITRFMGMTFVHSEQILSVAGEDAVLVYPRSALCLGIWDDINVRIDERPDRNYATQVYARMTIGATRTHSAGSTAKGKIVRILCVP